MAFSLKLHLVLFLLFIFIHCNSGTIKSSSDSETIKYKCREHIEEALKHYWEVDEGKEKHIESDAVIMHTESVDEDDDDDDDDDDEDEGLGKSVDEVSCDESDSDGKDEDNDDDDDDDEDEDEESDEKKTVEDVTEEDDEKDEEDEDETNEESDEKESAEVEAKISVEETAENSTESDEKDETVEADNKTASESNQNESDESDDIDTKEEKTEESEAKTAESESGEDEKKEVDTGSKESEEDETKESEEEKDDDKSDEKHVDTTTETREDTKEAEDANETKEETTEDTKEASNEDDISTEEDDSDNEPVKSRSYIEDILKLYEIGTKEESSEQNLIQSIFKDMKKIYETAIKPLEQIYKYRALTNRLITDAEIFAKPMVLLLGAKGSGKTSLINYILGIESTPWQLKTGLKSHSPHFTVINHGDTFSKLSPTELSADFTLSSLQQFGQHFVQHHMHAFRMPMTILQKMTIVDSPGLIDGLQVKPEISGKGIDSEVYQWFIDRSDMIYVVIDVTQLHMTTQLHSLIDQLKGRDVRFIITKADTVKHSQLIMLIGQLLWVLSPVMTSEEPPQVYALTTSPVSGYDPFLDDQEQQWLQDLSEQINGIERVESRVSLLRRHALRVRNHAKIIDCYINTYYRNKGIFTFGESARKLAKDIIEKPSDYRVFSGSLANQSQNISRYDLPDPELYKEFFLSNSLTDFKPLSSTCSFFKGCPLDKLDAAIAYQLPELIGKYKKLTKNKN